MPLKGFPKFTMSYIPRSSWPCRTQKWLISVVSTEIQSHKVQMLSYGCRTHSEPAANIWHCCFLTGKCWPSMQRQEVRLQFFTIPLDNAPIKSVCFLHLQTWALFSQRPWYPGQNTSRGEFSNGTMLCNQKPLLFHHSGAPGGHCQLTLMRYPFWGGDFMKAVTSHLLIQQLPATELAAFLIIAQVAKFWGQIISLQAQPRDRSSSPPTIVNIK